SDIAAQGDRTAFSEGGSRNAAAAIGVPLVEAHLCAGDRRQQRQDCRIGVIDGEADAGKHENRRQQGRRQGGGQAGRRAGTAKGRQGRGVRSRWLSLSRTNQGARRCGARKRAEILTERKKSTMAREPRRERERGERGEREE